MATTKEMAEGILKDGKIRGKEISEKQKAFFQDVVDGKRQMGQPKKKTDLGLTSKLI